MIPIIIRRLAVLILGLAMLLAGSAARAGDRGPCLHIDQGTAFAPRGEVYVEVSAACSPADFGAYDEIIAYVEVLVNDLPPTSEEIRVSRQQPKMVRTLVFDDLSLLRGDPVLVRLTSFGDILALHSTVAQ